MALSKPIAPAAFSSMTDSRLRYDGRLMPLYIDRCYPTICKYRRSELLTKEFLTLVCGNYLPAALDKYNETRPTPGMQPTCQSLMNNLERDTYHLEYLRERGFRDYDNFPIPLSPATIAEIAETETSIAAQVEAATPIFEEINRINFEMYEPYKFESIYKTLSNARCFQTLADRFFSDFFYFSCYAKTSEKVIILELVLRRGQELFALIRDSKPQPPANACLFFMLEYHESCKKVHYNAHFEGVQLMNRTDCYRGNLFDKVRDRLFKARRANTADWMRKFTDFGLLFLCDRHFEPPFPRSDTPLEEMAREGLAASSLANVVREMRHIYSFVHQCGLAFTDILVSYTRAKRGARADAVAVQHSAPIYGLSPELLSLIWHFAYPHLSARTEKIERRRPNRNPAKPDAGKRRRKGGKRRA
jgi:hypothetical protein